MPKNEMRIKYKLRDDIKEKLQSDGVLLIRISNILGGEMEGLMKMIKRDSQTLMHIAVLEKISIRFKIDVAKLYEEFKLTA